MKTIKYICLLLLTFLVLSSCEKNIIEFNATPTNLAEFQIHYFEPITPANSSFYMYKIEINNKLVANSLTPLNSYNALPSAAVGLFYTAEPGEVNIKMYRNATKPELVYDKSVALAKGKQNLVIHDLQKAPIVYDLEYPFLNDRKTVYTDTVGYVKFYNILYEKKNVPTNLTLQYQYQYILHPIYTEEDRDKGLIPEGKKLGDATGDTRRSIWFNLGMPVAFGETTGWQEVPVKKSTFLAQGSANIYYRILVTSGGEVGVTMNADKVLLARTTATGNPLQAYNDFWSLTVGRRMHQFFSGTRSETPGSAVRQFTAK